MKPLVLMFNEDDPTKCSAAKLVRFGLVKKINRINRNTIVLNPYSKIYITKDDGLISNSICAVDCSWERIIKEPNLKKKYFSAGVGRKLPAFLAGNPINYAKVGKLSTAEALSAAFYIIGQKDISFNFLNKFKWGHTFLDLNKELLEEYCNAQSIGQIIEIEKEFFPFLYKDIHYQNQDENS